MQQFWAVKFPNAGIAGFNKPPLPRFYICKLSTALFALQKNNTETSKQIFPGKELRGYSPSSYIHVSVNDLYIPLIVLPIMLQENRLAERGNI